MVKILVGVPACKDKCRATVSKIAVIFCERSLKLNRRLLLERNVAIRLFLITFIFQLISSNNKNE